MNTFFIIIQPGLEEILATKLKTLYPEVTDYKIEKGGIEVNCPMDIGCSFNSYLKSATRVLLRVKSFTCRDLPKLFQQCSKIDWNQYVVNGNYDLEVTCSGSRLNNEKRVMKAVNDGITTYLKGHQPKKSDSKFKSRIFVRVHNDHCQISIDTSGDPLYMRTAKHVGDASLRESIAYALLDVLQLEDRKSLTIMDPMCGSGTFILEALKWSESRKYHAYQHFPAFKGIKEHTLTLSSLDIKTAICADIDAKVITAATHNLDGFSNVEFIAQDIEKTIKANKADVVICNFPYGKRLQVEQKDLNKWFHLVSENAKTWGLLAPASLEIEGHRHIDFRNGGIPVRFYYKLLP